MRIQLLGTSDPSTYEDSTAVGRWREYVATYVLKHPTEWLPAAGERRKRGPPLFLKRCVRHVHVWRDLVRGESERRRGARVCVQRAGCAEG